MMRLGDTLIIDEQLRQAAAALVYPNCVTCFAFRLVVLTLCLRSCCVYISFTQGGAPQEELSTLQLSFSGGVLL